MSILLFSHKIDIGLPPGLRALYSFASDGAQSLTDSSGQGHDGVLGSSAEVDSNDPVWSSAGLTFASDDFVDCSAHAGLRPNAWTICVAIKQTPGTTNPIVGWGGSSFPALYSAAPFNSNRPLIWLASGCFRYFEAANPVNVQDGEWHFLSFRCPENTAGGISESTLFVDGFEQAVNGTTATENGLTKTTFRLGAAGLTYFAQADVAFLSLHDRVLSETEMEVMRSHARGLLDGRVALP